MSHLTIKQRSQLVRAAERGLVTRPNRGDYLLAGVGIVGCVVMIVLRLLEVA
jgi:hypothetical protein